jgi:hypothetical protein
MNAAKWQPACWVCITEEMLSSQEMRAMLKTTLAVFVCWKQKTHPEDHDVKLQATAESWYYCVPSIPGKWRFSAFERI